MNGGHRPRSPPATTSPATSSPGSPPSRRTLAGVWRLIDTALADLPAVLADLGRARAELEAVRLDRANLLAAIRATLAADAEGEPDPLGYLRDELDSTDAPASTRRRA